MPRRTLKTAATPKVGVAQSVVFSQGEWQGQPGAPQCIHRPQVATLLSFEPMLAQTPAYAQNQRQEEEPIIPQSIASTSDKHQPPGSAQPTANGTEAPPTHQVAVAQSLTLQQLAVRHTTPYGMHTTTHSPNTHSSNTGHIGPHTAKANHWVHAGGRSALIQPTGPTCDPPYAAHAQRCPLQARQRRA